MKSKKRFTILILDDSPEDQETYRRFLLGDQTNTFDLHTAYYAAEGLQFCETQWPDLIILDFMLPDLNGIQFIDALQEKAKGRTLPAILVLTGQGNTEVAVALMKKGVQDYLSKSKLTARNFQLAVLRILEQVQLRQSLEIQQQWQKVLAEVALHIRQSLELVDVLNTAVQEVKKFLNCDRVVVYRFEKDWTGNVVAEAVDSPWTSSLGAQIVDTCFLEDKGQLYQRGRQKVIDDIEQAGLSECHIHLLEQFQVRAVLVVPILLTPDNPDDLPRLWGLLIAHQCQSTRKWTDGSVLFLDQLSVQLAIAIQQAELLQQLHHELTQRTQAEQNLRNQAQEQQWYIEELAKTTQLLEQRNRDLDLFVSTASHDLRSPLRAIRNLATWLAEDLENVLNPEMQQQFNLLISRSQQMEALLNDLLQYARLGRIEDVETTVCVVDLIHEIIKGLEVPHDFTIQIAPDLPNLITSRTALEQVFTNLISNAVKHHSRADGQVEITASLQDNVYRFEVVDDGPGIAPEHHQSVFEIFKTLGNAADINSTGVGLAIVKKLIELKGGTIVLESDIGRGTTFRFTWPL